MTFKHVKFEDSPVMRSLEKVAHEKGMIKNDPVVKTAAKKATASLIPSDSLLDNVMRLCAGLRERGFVKQAEDVENNLVLYKQSQAMYGVSKEEGKDLVEFAHPEGSHKLEGVDAKDDGAVFEDILDQMAKSIEVVQKKPTGKLTEAQKAIQAVKVVLGATPLDVNSLYAQAQDALEKFRTVASTIADKMGEGADYDAQYLDSIKQVLDQRRVHAVGNAYGSRPFSEVLTSLMSDMESYLEPSYFNPFDWGGPSAWSPERQQEWQEAKKIFPLVKKYADRFHAAVSQIESIEGTKAEQEEAKSIRSLDPEMDTDAVVSKLNGLVSQLSKYLPRVSKYKTAVDYINSETQDIKALIEKITQQGATPELNAAVAAAEKDVSDFATSWRLQA
jgi:hypothetical protein